MEKYLEHVVNEFGRNEAEREESTLVWIDFQHKRLPETLQYRKVKVHWNQDDLHYGPQTIVKEKLVVVYSTKVDQRRRKISSKLRLQRDVTHTNVFDVWSLDSKELVSEKLFTAGLKGIIETKIHSEESYAHEIETTIHIKQTETISVRTQVPLAARSVTKVSWIIREDEAEMKWSVATHISGYFAICLKNSSQKEHILVFSVAALSSVDYRLEVHGSTEVVRVTHGTIKSVKATGSYIRVNETFPNSRKQVRPE